LRMRRRCGDSQDAPESLKDSNQDAYVLFVDLVNDVDSFTVFVTCCERYSRGTEYRSCLSM
jgi:hypothetical protein